MPPAPEQIRDDLRPAVRGGVAADVLTRGAFATDAGPFRVVPAAVAFPQDEGEVRAAVRYAADHDLSIVPRGAGTGLAGEALGPGIVLDLSRHFRGILEIRPESIRVEPGVTLAELNAALAPHGRRFAPDPGSTNATAGGMVATNASGGTSFRHGYTRDYVESLRVVWPDGSADDTRSPKDPRTGEISAGVAELVAEHAGLITSSRPKTKYDRCGYALHAVRPGPRPDLSPLIVGSEGTLAVVTAVTLRTIPLPGGVAVAALGFASLDAALKAGADLRFCDGVAGADVLDQRLLSLSRSHRPADGIGPVPPAVAAAVVFTVEADTEHDALRLATDAIAKLRDAHRVCMLAEATADPAGVRRVRAFREAAVSGLYALGAGRRPEAFLEDVAVPVDSVPLFVAGVQDILRGFELSASVLVHALTGQVHARPLVDVHDPADRAKLWPAADAVHALALAAGGTVSTQHGVGLARTPWVEKQFGPLAAVFGDVKRLIDPKNTLNPGKIVGPDPARPAWPLRGEDPPAAPAKVAVPLLVWKTPPAAEAAKCTGCGDCKSRGVGRMCPAFRGTNDELASPRAMANLFAAGPPAGDALRAVAAKCVNCKMCRDECRAKVDVPKLMLEAKAAHHAAHGLDRGDWFFARVEALAAVAGNFAFTTNALLSFPATRWAIEHLFGVSRNVLLPRFTNRTFLRRARRAGLTRRGPGTGKRVAYFADTFANANDPLIGEAVVAVLRHHGFEVHVPRHQRGSGTAPLAHGDVETARDTAKYNLRTFTELARDGYTILCSEPTAALAFTQEYPDLLPGGDAELVAENTVELTTFLGKLHAAGDLNTNFAPIPAGVGHHVPCHVKALRGPVSGPDLLRLIPELRVHTIDVGCSGMAGTWGLRAANRAASREAGRAMLAELDRPRVLFGSTECGSCRLQMQDGTGKRTLHPVQYLALAYGLVPELRAKLFRPLRPLLTD